MKKLKISTLCFLLLAFTSFTASAQYDKEAKQILDAMSAKYKKVPAFVANFSYTLKSPGEDINDEFQGKLTVKNNKYLLDLGEQVVFNNEKYQWTYLKDVNEVQVVDYFPDPENPSPTDVYSMYEEGFKYRVAGEEKIDGSDYKVVELNPEDRSLSYHKILLFIDAEDYTLRKWQNYEKSGRIYTYQIKNFTPKSNISDQTFVFNKDDKKYEGVEVLDLTDSY